MSKKFRILLFLLLTTNYYLLTDLYAANVKIVGKQMLVDGQPFIIRGVNYGYTPVGEGYMSYDWSSHPEFYKKDFALLRTMGANTIRLHGLPSNNNVLDAAYEYGIYVIITINVSWTANFADQDARNQVIDDVRTTVTKWKDHPAILMWIVGNEINYWNKVSSKSSWYSLLNECARVAHEIEGPNYHPVCTADSEIADLGKAENNSDDTSLPYVDLWAVQIYRGKYMDSVFTQYAAKTSKPMAITEFGCDAYNTKDDKEDEDFQANTISQQISTITNNLSANNPSNVCIGGCIFQWCDDWSKNQWGAANSVHDTVGTWSNTAYDDYVSETTYNMNEEWWGICAISAGTDTKRPRKAYTILKNAWAPSSIQTHSSTKVFQTDVKNYPNPFKLGQESTSILFTLAPNTNAEVKIYDIVGNLVKILSASGTSSNYNDFKIQWDGRDQDGNTVACGVYICYVEADGPSGSEIKYRKIMALK